MQIYIVTKVISGNRLEIMSVETNELEEIDEQNAYEYKEGEQVAVANGCIVS